MTRTHAECRVHDFVWLDGELVDTIDLCDAPDAVLARTDGQFALHQETNSGTHVLARDRIGVNKLFYAVAPDGTLASSHYMIDLVRHGHSVDSIWSVPAGHVLTVTPARRELSVRRYAEPWFNESPSWDPDDLHRATAAVRERLITVFRRLGVALRGRRVYVALSGGLDSTTIAALAREFIGEYTAVTFAVDHGGDRRSEDSYFAGRVAADLGVPLLTALAAPDDVLALLDAALLYGQDWRDFNVHCALVNAVLARAVSESHAASGSPLPPVVLTGDVMNELMADYSAVLYRGREYYRLPRLSPARLRRALVMGLDSGDREIGVFAHFGVEVVQPYAMCAAEYLALPGGLLEAPLAKQRLVQSLMGDAIPSYVYERPKVRAQTASAYAPGGTLSVLVDGGFDQPALSARFAGLFGTEPARLGTLVRGGVYRFTSTYPA